MKVLFFPIILQSFIFFIDEFVFHKKRRLPRWEVFGHPIDTLFFFIPISIITFSKWTYFENKLFIFFSILSCLIITKDEWIHKRESPAFENWLHSLLFVLHPVTLISIWNIKNTHFEKFLILIWFSILVVLIYQVLSAIFIIFKNGKNNIDNNHYSFLGDGWYCFSNHPIAILRAQSRFFSNWLNEMLIDKKLDVLDMACGAGFMANALALKGHKVFGVDIDSMSLHIARKHDSTHSVIYECVSAYNVPFENNTFDVVCIMDFLEHIEDALPLLKEASRVLKPNGLLITHTFNKTGLSWLLAVKAISFFFPSAPSDIHIFEYFKKPENLDLLAKESGLVRKEPWRGVRPKLSLKNLLNILLFSEVSNDFSFKWTKSQLISYVGVFLKK